MDTSMSYVGGVTGHRRGREHEALESGAYIYRRRKFSFSLSHSLPRGRARRGLSAAAKKSIAPCTAAACGAFLLPMKATDDVWKRRKRGIRGKGEWGKGEWGKGGRGVRGDKLGMPQGKLPEKQATAWVPQARKVEDGEEGEEGKKQERRQACIGAPAGMEGEGREGRGKEEGEGGKGKKQRQRRRYSHIRGAAGATTPTS